MTLSNSSKNPVVFKLAVAWPLAEWDDLNVLVAVSGGSDSVALLRGLHDLKAQTNGIGRLHVAHFNHGWRDKESDEDALWVAALCQELGLPFHCGSATDELGGSSTSEESARQQRYRFLQATAQHLGARYVCTAHTQNDQVETVLHRIIRGTGIAGLAGIPKVRQLGESVTLIRPLLEVSRQELLDYLASLRQPYRSDSSNKDLSFTRNRIRNSLLPALRDEYNPEVEEALLRLSRQADEVQGFLSETAERMFEQTVTIGAEERTILVTCAPLKVLPNLIAREVCKLAWRKIGWPEQSMGYSQWRELGDLVHAVSPRAGITLPGNVEVIRTVDSLSCRRVTK